MTFKPKHTTLFILFLVVSTLSLAQVKTTIRGNVVDEKYKFVNESKPRIIG